MRQIHPLILWLFLLLFLPCGCEKVAKETAKPEASEKMADDAIQGTSPQELDTLAETEDKAKQAAKPNPKKFELEAKVWAYEATLHFSEGLREPVTLPLGADILVVAIRQEEAIIEHENAFGRLDICDTNIAIQIVQGGSPALRVLGQQERIEAHKAFLRCVKRWRGEEKTGLVLAEETFAKKTPDGETIEKPLKAWQRLKILSEKMFDGKRWYLADIGDGQKGCLWAKQVAKGGRTGFDIVGMHGVYTLRNFHPDEKDTLDIWRIVGGVGGVLRPHSINQPRGEHEAPRSLLPPPDALRIATRHVSLAELLAGKQALFQKLQGKWFPLAYQTPYQTKVDKNIQCEQLPQILDIGQDGSFAFQSGKLSGALNIGKLETIGDGSAHAYAGGGQGDLLFAMRYILPEENRLQFLWKSESIPKGFPTLFFKMDEKNAEKMVNQYLKKLGCK